MRLFLLILINMNTTWESFSISLTFGRHGVCVYSDRGSREVYTCCVNTYSKSDIWRVYAESGLPAKVVKISTGVLTITDAGRTFPGAWLSIWFFRREREIEAKCTVLLFFPMQFGFNFSKWCDLVISIIKGCSAELKLRAFLWGMFFGLFWFKGGWNSTLLVFSI